MSSHLNPPVLSTFTYNSTSDSPLKESIVKYLRRWKGKETDRRVFSIISKNVCSTGPYSPFLTYATDLNHCRMYKATIEYRFTVEGTDVPDQELSLSSKEQSEPTSCRYSTALELGYKMQNPKEKRQLTHDNFVLKNF